MMKKHRRAIEKKQDKFYKEKGNKLEQKVRTHKFKPVTTDRIRIWITSANGGKNVTISELECYSK